MIQIDQNSCIGCKACIKDCPAGAIRLEEGKAVWKKECIQCGHCVAVCPVKAVSIPEYDMEEVEEYDRDTFTLDPDIFLHAVKFRRSIRNYKETPVEREKMERILRLNGVLGSVECYKKAGGIVCVEVTQRVPVMRVMANGGNYYVDTEGRRMVARAQYRAHLPLVTGCVDSVMTYSDLLPLARYIYNDSFWNAQIEQIYVNERHEIELIPRVGRQTILLGSAQDYETKLDNLMQVYRQVFNQTGWSMYDTVSLKFKDQVVCTRRKKW